MTGTSAERCPGRHTIRRAGAVAVTVSLAAVIVERLRWPATDGGRLCSAYHQQEEQYLARLQPPVNQQRTGRPR